MYVCMYVCMYIYIYIYIHTHTHHIITYKCSAMAGAVGRAALRVSARAGVAGSREFEGQERESLASQEGARIPRNPFKSSQPESCGLWSLHLFCSFSRFRFDRLTSLCRSEGLTGACLKRGRFGAWGAIARQIITRGPREPCAGPAP